MGPPPFWFLLIILTFWQATKTPSSRHRHCTPWGQGQAPGGIHLASVSLMRVVITNHGRGTFSMSGNAKRLKGKWEEHRTKVPEMDINSSVCRTFWTFFVTGRCPLQNTHWNWRKAVVFWYQFSVSWDWTTPPDPMGIRPAYPLCSANPTRVLLTPHVPACSPALASIS